MSVFTDRVAVVTGAGSGIGRALARVLARDGARLALSDTDPDAVAATAAEVVALGATVRSDRLDVTERDTVLGYADDVAAEFGGVHLVVNNAGVAHIGSVLAMDFTDIERVLDVNFWGVVHGTKAFLPHLIASGDGRLVNISSLFGLLPMADQSAYVAAKHAVRGFTESLRVEMLVAGLPVAVTCVHPGGVATSIARSATRNPGRQFAVATRRGEGLLRMPPDRAAAVIVRAAARRKPRVLVGRDARLGFWLSNLGARPWQAMAARGYRRVLRGR